MSVEGNWRKRRVEPVSRMGEIDRRTFVKLSGASAAALVFGAGPFTEKAMARVRFEDYPFKLGVASGDPLPEGVVLWARLAPDPLNDGGMPDRRVTVQWQVATDERFRNIVREGDAFARPELAHSVHVEVGGLAPAREYFYRFRAGPDLSPAGRTKTAPALGASLAEINVLDTRQYRDDQAAGDGTDPPNPEQQDPARTLTGDAQERWLLDGLSSSSRTWKVLAQQVFMAQRDFDISDAERYSMDAWDGYLGSRNRILGYIDERNIANPVVLTGDVHNNWANNLKANFYDQSSKTLCVEFVGTSVTSGGDGADTTPGNLPVIEENPHIEFFNGQRGYVRCTLTPQEWRADYRVLPYVKQPGAQIYTRASFVTEAGNPGLQQAGETQVPSRPASLVETDVERIRAQESAARGGHR